jgi:hypothetical protein
MLKYLNIKRCIGVIKELVLPRLLHSTVSGIVFGKFTPTFSLVERRALVAAPGLRM